MNVGSRQKRRAGSEQLAAKLSRATRRWVVKADGVSVKNIGAKFEISQELGGYATKVLLKKEV